MKRMLIGVLLSGVLAVSAGASGLFLGAEMVPWTNETVRPIYTLGWEGPIDPVNFAWTLGFTNPVVLDDWYMTNLTVLTSWPRTENVRIGLGYELWARYGGGGITNSRHSINATGQLQVGSVRVYLKPHLPFPVGTGAPYLGVSLSIGAYIVLPDLFPQDGE